MNDDQVLEKLSETDLYAADTLMPVSAWSREAALSEIERRTGMDTRDTTSGKETPPGVSDERKPSARPSTPERLMKETGRRRWSGALVGAAAFAVVVIVGVAILLASKGRRSAGPCGHGDHIGTHDHTGTHDHIGSTDHIGSADR